jgi:protein-tyrosine kinase
MTQDFAVPTAASSPIARAGRHAAPHPLHAAPARFDYTATRVLPAARMALASHVGIVHGDRSPLAETFKMLRTQVLQRMQADGHRVLAVTSPRAVGGKSTTALNLALAIAADFDTTALLVDADLGGTGLQRLFGLDGAAGLGDHLLRGEALEGLLVNPGIERFVFLPAGEATPLQSSELLATRVMRDLVAEMKARYDDRIVVVDLPPALDTADALSFLPLADTTLVVIEEHATKLDDMEALARLLAPFELVGSVMSRT